MLLKDTVLEMIISAHRLLIETSCWYNPQSKGAEMESTV